MFPPLRPVRALVALALIAFAACTNDTPTAPRLAPADANPLIVQTPIGYIDISQQDHHSCGLRSDGAFECWGTNYEGEAEPIRGGGGLYKAVAAGGWFTCGLRTNGTIDCFGGDLDTPSFIWAGIPYVQVSASNSDACALRADGAIDCDDNDHHSAQTGTFVQVSAGILGSCAVRSDGAVECWGLNSAGQAPPLVTPSTGKFTQVSTFYFNSCAVRDDGVIECWGMNRDGAGPPTVSTPGGFSQVGVSDRFSCGLRNDGVIECWGGLSVPATKTAATGHFTKLSVGGSGFCALRSDGATECWGGSGGQSPDVRYSGTTGTHILPTADFSVTPNAVHAGQSFSLSFDHVQVPGHPEAASFTFEFDCGTGYLPATTTGSVTCPTTTAGTLTVKGKVIDQDNDVAEYTGTVDVSPVDVTPPVITANVSGTAGTNGWYTGNVTVSWTIADNESAVSSAPCVATTITTDTNGQTVSCSATSLGGTGTQSVVIKRDATAPTLAPSVAPNPVLLGASATATPNATDTRSGLASSSCASVTTSTAGSKTVSCTATDLAGNTATAPATYTVTFAFSGFASPIDGGTVLNIAKAGQTIPLKWRLLDGAGNPITTLTTVTVSVSTLTCSSGTSADDLEEYSAGNEGLQNLGNGYYQYNWKAPKSYANSCKTLLLNMGEGVTRTALFQFK